MAYYFWAHEGLVGLLPNANRASIGSVSFAASGGTGRGNFCKSPFFLMWAKRKSMNDIMEGTCIELPTSIFWCRHGRSATISFNGGDAAATCYFGEPIEPLGGEGLARRREPLQREYIHLVMR